MARAAAAASPALSPSKQMIGSGASSQSWLHRTLGEGGTERGDGVGEPRLMSAITSI